MTIWITPLMFAIGGTNTLRGHHDLDGYCKIQELNQIPLLTDQIRNLTESERAEKIIESYSKLVNSDDKVPGHVQVFQALSDTTHITAPKLVRGAAQFEHEGIINPECREYSKKDVFEFN